MKFKDDFIFGGATAAYQCEGSIADYGKGKNEWDVFLEEKGRFKADPASDFYHQYPVDLKLCHDFGVNGIRISIAWTRIFPDGTGEINKEGVEFYHKLFKKCHEEGVEPFVTLHHFDSPAGLYADGDFMNPKTIDAFVEYAKFCFEEYKDDVTYWFTFNEIWAVATNTYIEGTFPNGVQYDMASAIQLMHNMMVAHAKAVIAYKEAGYEGKIGIVHSLESKYPYDETKDEDIKAAKNEDVLNNQFLLDATFLGEYRDETMEIINHLVELNNGCFHASKEDKEVLKKASLNSNTPQKVQQRKELYLTEKYQNLFKEKSKWKMKPVHMIKNNEIIQTFESLQEASRYITKTTEYKGKDKTAKIKAVCDGERSLAYGYQWEYNKV